MKKKVDLFVYNESGAQNVAATPVKHVVSCVNCQTKLRIDRQNVAYKCPKCGAYFQAQKVKVSETDKVAQNVGEKMKKPSKLKNFFQKHPISVFAIISFVFLFAYAVSLIFPLLWSLMTSLKSYNDYVIFENNGLGWPAKLEFSNYVTIFSKFVAPMETEYGDENVGIAVMALNSLWYAVGTSIVSTMASFLVGYVVARFKFKFCGIIYTVVILQMIIPTVGTLPSELRIAQSLHLYNTVHGMLFMKSYVTGLYFLSFYAALRVIPKDYTEAAYLDGAGNFRVMFNIMLPMASGIFSTVLLLNFIAFWNDYQTPLIYMPSFPTLAFGLWYYVNGSFDLETSNTPMQLGGCMLMAIPLLTIFFIFQKKLLGNVSIGGLK